MTSLDTTLVTTIGLMLSSIQDTQVTETNQWELLANVFQILSLVIGGLGIFLLGMKNMSEGLQAVAGKSLRRLINAVTNNRFMAAGVGTIVTCIVQSSSVTTVMVVGFVNSGLMTLTQAIGVIMGANIGTTITGWILVLKISQYGLPLLGIAAFVYLFSRREKWRYTAMAFMGIGMIFFGLVIMKDGVKVIKEYDTFKNAFLFFTAESYWGVLKCAFIGCVLTMIVQSSSATLGMTIALATEGVIDFHTAAALIVGQNIGTTITAYLASLGTTTNAKRAAYFHVAFNILGAIWVIVLFWPYVHFIQYLHDVLGKFIPFFAGDDIVASIALVHTGFNVANTIIFIPFVALFANLLTKYIPDKALKEKPHLTKLDVRMLETPSIGVEQSRAEIIRMGDGVNKMLDWIKDFREDTEINEDIVNHIFHREEVLDLIQHEIMVFMTDLLSGNVPHSISEEGSQQVRIADEYESISDVLVSILKTHLKVRNSPIRFDDEQINGIKEVHESVTQYVHMVTEGFRRKFPDVLAKAHTYGKSISFQVRELRQWHIEQLSQSKCDPLISMSFTAILQAYRHIKDHALNIAEAVAGEK